MNCDRTRELISDSLDGVLADNLKGKFDRHVRDCAPCRAFHAQMKDSLLLLEELPAVEVDAGFDGAVWARIRAQESPAGAWSRLRIWAVAMWREAFPGTFWKWSPVGVAAGVVLAFAIVSEPPPSSGIAQARVTKPASSRAAAPAAASRVHYEVGQVLDARSGSLVGEEIVAGIPNAVEKYLQNSRDLRLRTDADRFRRSNYSYPLRRVQDPSFVPVTGGPNHGPVRRTPEGQSPGIISF